MAVTYFRANHFVKSGTTQVVTTGFRPKAFIFFGSGRSATGYSAGDYSHFHGLSDGSNHVATAHFSADGHPTSANSTYHLFTASACIGIVNASSVVVTGYVSAVSETGFTVTWSSTAGDGMYIGYAAIGGDDVAAVVGYVAAPGSSPSSVGVSTPWDPTAVICLSQANRAIPISSIGFGPTGIGFIATTGQASSTADSVHAAPYNRRRCIDASRCVRADGAAGVEYRASGSLGSGGFTLSFTAVPFNGVSGCVPYMAMKGVQSQAGTFTDADASVSCAGVNVGLVLTSCVGNVDTLNSPGFQNRFSVGAADRLRNVGTWAGDAAVDFITIPPTRCGTGFSTSSSVLAATPGASSVASEVAGSISPTNNSFNLTFTQKNGGRQSIYLALGGDPQDIFVPIDTPDAPQIDCDPQTEVGAGGRGAAGCNTGGVGFVTTNDYTAGGIPEHDDPDVGELVSGKVGLEVWIELVHEGTTYRRAMVPLSDRLEGGYKSPGLVSVGVIEHALGNERGGYEPATIDVELSDTFDNLIRGIIGDDEEIEGDELRVKIGSDELRGLI